MRGPIKSMLGAVLLAGAGQVSATAAAPNVGIGGVTAKRAITHEDLWLMKRVGAPIASPDAKWVVVSVTEPAYDAKAVVSDLWILPATGGTARRLTSTLGKESGVSWSHDSRRIAFSAKRDGDEVEQIYVLSLDGGEAIRVTQSPTGARSPQFSPDGRAMAFVSNVYPGTLTDEDNKRAATERKERKWNARIYDGFPIRQWDHWIDDKPVRLFVQLLDAVGTAQGPARNLLGASALVKAAGFAGRSGDGGDELDAIWALDGKSLVFVASTDANAAAYAFTHTDLFAVDALGGEPRKLRTTAIPGARHVLRPVARCCMRRWRRATVRCIP